MLTPSKTKLKTEGKIVLTIKVTPKSGQQKVTKILDDGTVKIKLRSAPEDNKANEELIGFLGEVFEVPEKNIKILSGSKSPLKMVEIIQS